MMQRATWLLALVMLLGPARATSPAEEPARRPNILFAIADDWSYGHASCLGCSWVQTPAFDRVVEQGVLFTRAYTPNPKCAPARSIILTGRHSWQLEAAANHWPYFPAKFKLWSEVLAEHGYAVGYTGKGWGPGVAKTADGKPRAMTGKRFHKRFAPPPAKGISRIDYAANFRDFLDSLPQGRPWCFWYGGYEPHRRYESGSGRRAGKRPEQIRRVPGYWPDVPTVRNDMLDYAVEVEHFDRHLGRMLAELERRGLLDNTVVIVTSDHGMPFPRVKGQCYEDGIHVPLAVMWPAGIKHPGRKVSDFVDFTDLAPTILELAGISWQESGMAPMVGRSLLPLLKSDRQGQIDPARDHLLLGKERHDLGRPHDQGYPVRGIRRGPWLLLVNYEPSRWPVGNPETGYLNCDGSPTKTVVLNLRDTKKGHHLWELCFGKRPPVELYNVQEDPDCLHNLADKPEHRELVRKLRSEMETKLRRQGDPRMFGRGEVFDRYPHANPRGRFFYERFLRGEDVRAGWVNPSDIQINPENPQARRRAPLPGPKKKK